MSDDAENTLEPPVQEENEKGLERRDVAERSSVRLEEDLLAIIDRGDLEDNVLPLPRFRGQDEHDAAVCAAVCRLTKLTPAEWKRLTPAARIPWLEAAIKEALAERGDRDPDGETEKNREAAAPNANQKTRKKKSTEKGEAQDKLMAALTAHHGYTNGECTNREPIGNNELARMAGVQKGSASSFFKKYFTRHCKYKTLCRSDFSRIVLVLKSLNSEFVDLDTYGSVPPGDRDRDDE